MKLINLKIKPYSLWLSYNIINHKVIEEMLPEGMQLAKIKVSDDNDCMNPKLLFNCYNIDSFWMRGSSREFSRAYKNYRGSLQCCPTSWGRSGR